MAISTRYQGQTPPESTRTEKAKQSEATSSSSKSSAVGQKRNQAGQKDSETSDSESDSLPPPKKSRQRHKKVDEVIELDDEVVSKEARDSVAAAIELSDLEEVAAAAKGGKRKQHAGSDGDKGSEAEVSSHICRQISQH